MPRVFHPSGLASIFVAGAAVVIRAFAVREEAEEDAETRCEAQSCALAEGAGAGGATSAGDSMLQAKRHFWRQSIDLNEEKEVPAGRLPQLVEPSSPPRRKKSKRQAKFVDVPVPYRQREGIRYFHISQEDFKKRQIQKTLQRKAQRRMSRKQSEVLKEVLRRALQLEEAQHANGTLNPNASREELTHLGSLKKVLDDLEDNEHLAFVADLPLILRAIEQICSNMNVNYAAKEGMVITSDVIEAVFGIPGTMMERGPVAHHAAIQGDMHVVNETHKAQLLEALKSGQRWAGNLWEDPRDIKYCFATDIAAVSQQAFLDAVQHYKNLIPCMNFRQVAVADDANKKCEEEPAIYVFSSSSGCYATVGAPWYRNGEYGASYLHLSPVGCATMGTAVHELGHNLGMTHEQARSDVADHVTILWDNIMDNYKDQYATEPGADTSIPYDLMSVMHYGDTFFAKTDTYGNKMKTMQPVGTTVSVMGNDMGLTDEDAQQIGKMYGCLEQVVDFTLCTSSPLQCTSEDCVCHQQPDASSNAVVKTTESGCNRCLERCPDAPYGSPGVCGCPEGCTKSCFVMLGSEYCGCGDRLVESPPPPSTRTSQS